MSAVQLTIIGKPDCHLCDVAQAVIDGVVAELSGIVEVSVAKRSILDDRELYDRYREQIPVILVNGEQHANWRVDASKLRSAILEG